MARVKIVVEDVRNSIEPIILNNRHLLSLKSYSEYSDSSKISYSVIPNSGKVELTDYDGSLYRKLNPENYPDGMLLSLYLNNNIIQRHIIKDSSYNVHDRKVNLSLTNGLEALNTTLGRVYMLDHLGNRTFAKTSLYDVFKRLMSIIGIASIDDMMQEYIIRGANNDRIIVKNYLQNISIRYAYLESATVRENIDKICAVAQLNFIEDDKGQMKFIDARPVFCESEQKPVVINTNNIYEPLIYDPFSPTVIKQVGYIKKTTSDTEYVSVGTYSVNLYEQASLSTSGSTSGYPANTEKYTRLWQISGEGSRIINLYEDPNNYKNKIVLCRVNIPFKDDLLSDLTKFQVKITNCSYNTLPSPLPTKIDVASILVNKNEYDAVTNGTYTPAVFFYSNEEEAIESFSRFNYPFTQLSVVKHENSYMVYFTLFDHILGDIVIDGSIYLSYNIEFSVPTLASSENEVNSGAKYTLPNNELIHTLVKYGNDTIYTEQSRNVISDYGEGVLSGSVIIGLADYYDEDGNLKINSSLGQIVNEGEILYFPYDTKITGEKKYWKVKTRDFRFNGRPLLFLNVIEANILLKPRNFAEDSWDKIAEMSRKGFASSVYNVGDTKTIRLSTGEQVVLVILGFNHDTLTSGGKAGITIGMKDFLGTSIAINKVGIQGSTAGGWRESTMRTSALQEIFNELPDELKSVIKPVNKNTVLDLENPQIDTTSDTLWLLSPSEIALDLTNQLVAIRQYVEYYKQEGSIYEYWSTRQGDWRKFYSDGGSGSWWLRSPLIGTGNQFALIRADGDTISYGYSISPRGVSFCFCI